jgi:hypothetical protein
MQRSFALDHAERVSAAGGERAIIVILRTYYELAAGVVFYSVVALFPALAAGHEGRQRRAASRAPD